MTWRLEPPAARERYLAKYCDAEASAYDALHGLGRLQPDDEAAYRADIDRVFQFRDGMRVLDAGAGTGTLCKMLARYPGLALTALEPAPAMLARLRNKPELRDVVAVCGFCDSQADRVHFDAGSFDVIASRQLVNSLFDPLAAFRNWHYWLTPGGAVIVIDGLYGRSGWTGHWAEEVDTLPLSACETMATTPYLLEQAGFRVESVDRMAATNTLRITRTPRYVVIATRR